MAEIKQVVVNLSEADSKALLGGKTRRRRRAARVSTEEDMGDINVPIAPISGGSAEPLSPSTATTAMPAPEVAGPKVVVAKGGALPTEPESPLAPPQPAVPPTIMPAVSTTTAVGGGCAVAIKPKMIGGGEVPIRNPIQNAPNAPKIILSKKRVGNAAAAVNTLKKPRFIVSGASTPATNVAQPPLESGAPRANLEGAKKQALPQPQAGAGAVRKTFRARRISITMKPTQQSRKFRKTLKTRVATMPIGSVKKLLLRKGVLKPKPDGSYPPEDIMRSMLTDYMMLHNTE